jgi:hypothetical protein
MEVLDFNRMNELCGDKNDPTEGKTTGAYGAYIKYPATRSVLKDMASSYHKQMVMNGSIKENDKNKYMIDTLRYNKILINVEQKKREDKINKLLDD